MRKKSTTISEKQLEILKYIIKKVKEQGYPPTVREIGSYFSLKSSATIHAHLKKLEELGYIKRNPLKPRAIEILDTNASIMQKVSAPYSQKLSATFSNDAIKEVLLSNLINEKDSNNYKNYNDDNDSPHNVVNHNDVVMVPIIGQIAAGLPILAVENIEDYKK